METKGVFRATPQLILGIMFIIVGMLYALDNMGLLYARDYLRFWPVFVIVYGLARIVQPRGTLGRFGGVIWLLVGIALLIDRLGVFDIRFWDLWPLLLVLIGFQVIRRSWAPRTAPSARPGTDSPTSADNVVSGFALMSGVRRTITSQDFRGGDLTAIMGGCEVDLRQASISGGTAVLDLFVFWGGIDIKVPQDWTVVVEGTPILGGFEDKTVQDSGSSSKRLVIKGIVIMGGTEIHN